MKTRSSTLVIYLVIVILDHSFLRIFAENDAIFESSFSENPFSGAASMKNSLHMDSTSFYIPAPPPPPTPPPLFIQPTAAVVSTLGDWKEIRHSIFHPNHESTMKMEEDIISPSLTISELSTVMVQNLTSHHLMEPDVGLQTSNVTFSEKSFDATVFSASSRHSTLQPTPSISHLATVMTSSITPPMGEVQPSATSPWPHSDIIYVEPTQATVMLIIYIIILDGNCSVIIKDRDHFGNEFRKQLSEILIINQSKILVYEISCGSVVINFTIEGADANLTTTLKRLIETNQIIIKFKEQNFTAFHLTTQNEFDLGRGTGNNWEWIIYIAAGVASGLLIIIIIVVCSIRVYRKNHGKSFDVAADTAHVNVTLEDYTLTRIPRPKTVYTYGVCGNTSRYHEYDENIKSNGVAVSDMPDKEPKHNLPEEGPPPATSVLKLHADNSVAKESPLRTFKHSPQKDNPPPPSPSGSSSPETFHGKSRSKEALSKESLDDIGKDGVENPTFKTEEGSLVDTPMDEDKPSIEVSAAAAMSVPPTKSSQDVSQVGKDNPSFIVGPEHLDDGDKNNN